MAEDKLKAPEGIDVILLWSKYTRTDVAEGKPKEPEGMVMILLEDNSMSTEYVAFG